MVKKIPLQNGEFALVDDEDFERVNEHFWHVQYLKGVTPVIKTNVIRTKKTEVGSYIQMKNFIYGDSPKEKIVVNKNGDKFDMRKKNLIVIDKKVASHSSKGHRKSTSKYKGVSWNKKIGKWESRFFVDGKNLGLGTYENEDDAAIAYNQAVLKHRGNNAFINKISKENNSTFKEKNKVKQYRTRSKSGYKGVSINYKGNLKYFGASIVIDGKMEYLGYYKSDEQAAKAYDKKAYELHGDKAILNFPEDYKRS
jgi:hypothetical protein